MMSIQTVGSTILAGVLFCVGAPAALASRNAKRPMKAAPATPAPIQLLIQPPSLDLMQESLEISLPDILSHDGLQQVPIRRKLQPTALLRKSLQLPPGLPLQKQKVRTPAPAESNPEQPSANPRIFNARTRQRLQHIGEIGVDRADLLFDGANVRQHTPQPRENTSEPSKAEIAKLILQLFTPGEISMIAHGPDISIYATKQKTVPRRDADLGPITTRLNAARITPFLQAHVNQFLANRSMAINGLTKAIRSGKLSQRERKILRAPFDPDAERGGGLGKFELEQSLLDGFLLERIIQITTTESPRRLKIVLGGTLHYEITEIKRRVEESLRTAAARLGVKAVEQWIEAWDVEIVGYSIRTEYLLKTVESLAKEKDPRLKRWLRLEYLDLMDESQFQRLAREQPDIVFTVNSLYIGSFFGDMDPRRQYGMSEKQYRRDAAKLMAYVRRVYKSLPHGGLFVTEQTKTRDAPFGPFLQVAKPKNSSRFEHSGFHYKGDTRNFPLSFLGAPGATKAELRLFSSWRLFLAGKTAEAAQEIYTALNETGEEVPRFATSSLLAILRVYEAQNPVPEIKLRKLKERLEAREF
ncbi:MAG: hypothetical protein COB53_12325 [Elusimicrobia bacterium]|nr:MAG: hypothetical protein COB53_12325 [Elusimicrobiota bacterium]